MTAIQRAINQVLDRRDLQRAEMAEVVGEIMDGKATPAQIGGFLVALRAKGEHIDELVGAATAMRARALALHVPDVVPGIEGSGGVRRTIDTCGTGGDGAGTVNISTLAAIILAACDATVAKHGNRALSSQCGSADVLEALGVAVDTAPSVVERSMQEAHIGFAFAPRFHAATKHAAVPRRELGTRTIFNLLGPLTNPGHVQHQVVGVFAQNWCEPMAAALGALGLRRAAVVCGSGGETTRGETAEPASPLARDFQGSPGQRGRERPLSIDEVSVHGETVVALWNGADVQTLTLTPRSFGLDDVDPAGLAGGDAAFNARVLLKVLANHHIDHGERLEAVLRAAAMTAALGLELLEATPFELERLPAQYATAVSAVKSGAARLALHRWCEASRAAPDDDLSYLHNLKAEDFAGVE